MRAALRIIAGIVSPGTDEVALPWHMLDYAHTAAVRSRVAESFAPATANRMLAALRRVLRTAFRLGLMSAEQMTRACDVEPIRGERVPKGRAVSQGELRALFGVCDPGTSTGARNAALLGLLFGAGLRRAEVVALDLENYDLTAGQVLVLGKGNKERLVPLPGGSREALGAWLALRGSEPGPLLYPVTKGGMVVPRRMTDGAVAQVAERLARRAKVTAFSPHDLRRSFVGDLLDAGADIATVQALVGHANPATTSRYDRRGDRAKQRAAELLHVPFARAGQEGV
jgi:site-specific recombinase XerD